MPQTSDPLHEVSTFRLKASYWYVTHKLQLRQLLVIFLVAVSVGLYSYSAYRALVLLVVEGPTYRAMLDALAEPVIDYQKFRQTQKPRPLEILSFDAVRTNNERYDFVAKVLNANENFVARRAVFQLVSGNQIMAEKIVMIYPGEERYVAIFGQDVGGASPILRLASVDWWRVHKFAPYREARWQFEISGIDFKPAGLSGGRGQLPVSRLDFTVTNRSAYGYWTVGINMVLLGAGSVAGANFTTIDQFRPGETRRVSMTWYDALPPVTAIEIQPEVDILDPAVYLPVE